MRSSVSKTRCAMCVMLLRRELHSTCTSYELFKASGCSEALYAFYALL